MLAQVILTAIYTVIVDNKAEVPENTPHLHQGDFILQILHNLKKKIPLYFCCCDGLIYIQIKR